MVMCLELLYNNLMRNKLISHCKCIKMRRQENKNVKGYNFQEGGKSQKVFLFLMNK